MSVGDRLADACGLRQLMARGDASKPLGVSGCAAQPRRQGHGPAGACRGWRDQAVGLSAIAGCWEPLPSLCWPPSPRGGIVCLPPVVEISTLRGLARSAIGIVSVSTPSW